MSYDFDWDSVLQYDSSTIADLPSSQFECSTPGMASASCPVDVIPQQLPTPPCSDHSSPPPGGQEDTSQTRDPVLSISSIFHPQATLLNSAPDCILLSSDGVFFYVHATRLLLMSSNRFRGLVTATGPGSCDDYADIISVPEDATVLNIVMHAVYGVSCAHFNPGVDALVAAVDAMAAYGLSPSAHIHPSTPLYALLLAQSPMKPIEVYALAATYNLHNLAVPVSSHLLSFSPYTLSEELATRIGPTYLRRLFFLHLGRIEALKRIIRAPPHPHPSTPGCNFAEQKKLARAWALSVAYLVWDARPDTTTSAIKKYHLT